MSKKLPSGRTQFAPTNQISPRHSKVSLEPFQRLIGQGQRPCRSPQRAKSFILHKAQEGRKTFQRNVFRREPSQGVPCGCRPTAKTRCVTAQDKTRCVTAQDKTRCVTAQDKTRCVTAQDKTRNRSTSLARSERRKIIDAVEVITNELPFGRTQFAPTINFRSSLLAIIKLVLNNGRF